MKKSYMLSILLGITVILLSSFTNVKHHLSAFVLALVNGPYLPETPYSYDIAFPNYLKTQYFWIQQNEAAINNSIDPKQATLGRVLFYDKALSTDNTVSCASCHKQEHGFADNTQFSEGINGNETTRNTPNINDLFWRINYDQADIHLFWDGREKVLNDMVMMPIANTSEMGGQIQLLTAKLNNIEYYPALFEDAFGTPVVTNERIKTALAQFIRSMNTFDSKYDKVKNGEDSFTESEAKGEAVFTTHCNNCHTAPLFSVLNPILNGFPFNTDLGMGAITGLASDNGKFKSPSLRNIANTAPYMHSGKFITLESVVDFYAENITFPVPVYYDPNGEPVSSPLTIPEEDRTDLIAFLNTLTSSNLTSHPKWSDPFQFVNEAGAPAMDEKVTVFPNPFSDQVQVKLATNAPYELRLTNLQGQVLRTIKTSNGVATIEKGDLPTGIYFLEILKDGRKSTHRIVIQ